MANKTPEQDLIDSCVKALRQIEDDEKKIDDLVNDRCRAKLFADIEYDSVTGQRWAIEVKSHETSDAARSVYC